MSRERCRDLYACYVCNGYITADGLTRYTMVARHAPAGCGAVRRRYVAASEALYAAGGSAPSPARANSRARCLRPMMPSQMCSASAYTAAVTILAMWCDR